MLIGPREFAEFAEKLEIGVRAGEEICVDCETSGLSPWTTRRRSGDRLIGAAVGFGAGEFYLPVEHAYGENLNQGQVEALFRILGGAESILNHHLQFDCQFLANAGLVLPRRLRCTMMLMQLLDENHSIGLKQCAKRYLGFGDEDAADLDSLLSLWGLAKDEMWRLPASAVDRYASTDVRLPPLLVKKFEATMPEDLREVWGMRNRCLPIVVRMERNGLHVDRVKMADVRTEAYREMITLQRQLLPYLGTMSPNSPKVAARLGLKDSQDETLSRSGHPAAPIIQKWRGYNKAVTSYYDPYEEFLDANDLIHYNMKMTGTETGRWSCRKPNVQAIPKWDMEQRVKECLTPRREGFVMAELDYSQAELRLAAHVTRDPTLVADVMAGKDLHQATADATGLSRDVAKTLNFSVVYGIGASKLAFELKVSEKEAYHYLRKFHDTYPGFREFARRAEQIARERGYVKLYNGRRRHFNSRDAETRKAFSNVIQGDVSQMEEQAAIDIAPVVEDAGGLIVNQVHDAYYLELPEDRAEEVCNLCREIMEDQPQFTVPILVDVKIGKDMKAMSKVERNK